MGKIEHTNGIPICPNCKKPTRRQLIDSSATCAYYPPVYDEEGNNVNPDRNIITNKYQCIACGHVYDLRIIPVEI